MTRAIRQCHRVRQIRRRQLGAGAPAIPAAKGLFNKAIVESGGGWSMHKPLQAEAEEPRPGGHRPGRGSGDLTPPGRCTPAARLLQPAAEPGRRRPFEDGRLIKETVAQAYAAGHADAVPLMIGSNSDEASLMKAFRMPASAMAQRRRRRACALSSRRRPAPVRLFTDDTVMGAHRPLDRGPGLEDRAGLPLSFRLCADGAARCARHAARRKIPFVFGGWPPAFDAVASPEIRRHGRAGPAPAGSVRQGRQRRFAGKAWPAFSPASDQLMEFSQASGVVANFRGAQYGALDRMLAPR